jgi:signal transduction histidine kinase
VGLAGSVLLGLLALAEAVTRAVAEHQPAQTVLGLSVLALGATLPLAFLRAAPAAVAVCASALLSLTLFQLLPAAGVAALLIAAGRLGHLGPPWWTPWLAVALGLPFLVLGLTGPVLAVTSAPLGTETHTVTLLAAALVPVAACAGLALRARSEATEHTAAREAIAGRLLEHTARGERARISRELHDVVAHHISMIAVQAETARLTAPALPPATTQRLRSIGDTARDALTEMRRLLGVLREDTGDGPGPADRAAGPGPGAVGVRDPAHRQRSAGQPGPGRGAGRLPDRAGGADQRAAARARGRRGRGAVLRRGRPAPAGPGQRPGTAAGAAQRRSRPAGHA